MKFVMINLRTCMLFKITIGSKLDGGLVQVNIMRTILYSPERLLEPEARPTLLPKAPTYS